MFSSPASSQSHLSTSRQPHASARPVATPAPTLPSGGCQFILLHSSVPDQRCSCQGFQLHETLPGAHCECGHQACYHSHDSLPQSTTEASSACYSTLVEKVRRLEAKYEHERKIWQEELKEEQRARREDVRVLREAVYSLYRFVEQDIPRKFDDVEDKIEGVVDCQQQLQERLMTVDDSTMALEDRVASLEDEQDSDGEGDEDEDEDGDDEATGQPLTQYGNDTARLDASLARQAAVQPSVGDECPASRDSHSYSVISSAPTSFETATPKSLDGDYRTCEESCSNSRSRRTITSTREDTPSIPSTKNTVSSEARLIPQLLQQARLNHATDDDDDDDDDACIKFTGASRTLDDEGSLPWSSSNLHDIHPAQLKRKRHGVDHEMTESGAESRHCFTLPSPPPLSLSSPDPAPGRCHVPAYSSFGLTN
ncbi:hypothetical protein PAAG_08626 [Paecilomyces variotii No. 5]|uniref:Uncharacterized protein n=1 Tax=Byssochlamys spectabilis (strain No. 5 / NBRC 109023) TaxID=1356009 RepID=V5GA25_BYSSN|nr:hypothetical protein PAAG_08626 [Paecilomyces variotii No. 5]